jgi:Tol biopolymer transport system component
MPRRRITRALARGLAMAAVLGASVPAWGQGTTERVSVGQGGVQANSSSYNPALSANGRFVAFSSASNLVPGDTNGTYDVFVHDRQSGMTERVSLGPNGIQGNGRNSWAAALSADGRFVAFSSWASNLVPGDTNDKEDVFVRTLAGRR